nr:DUF2510 domain-containing protein [Arthrobacter sp. zg-Y895]
MEAPAATDEQTAPTSYAAREAGFYPDPEGVAPFRYWDGEAWTSRVRMTK